MCVDCGGRPAFSRGLCRACYCRHWKRGTLDGFAECSRTEPPIPAGLDPLLRQLALRRRDLGVSRTLVSRALGYGNATPVSRLEEGRRQPGLNLLRRWAEMLGCELALVALDSDGEMEHDPVKLQSREQRRAQVRKLARRNYSAREIAKQARVSVRTVRRTNGHRAPGGAA